MDLRERMQAALRDVPAPPDRDPSVVFEQGRHRARRRRLRNATGGAAAVIVAVLALGFLPPLGGSGWLEITGSPDLAGDPVAWRQLGHASDKLPRSEAARVVTNQGELYAAWQRHRFEAPVPEVDFTRAVVLLLGQVTVPCPAELVRLEVDTVDRETGVLRTEWRGPSCILATGRFVYAVEVHRGLLPRRLEVEGDLDELRPVVLELPGYDGPAAPPPPDPSAWEADLDAVFADHPVRRCTKDENGWAVRDLSDWEDDGPPTRTKLEALDDLSTPYPEQVRIDGWAHSLEVIELLMSDVTREALDAIARVTDPQRVCITPV